MQDKSTLDTLLKARRLKKGNDVCSSSKLYLSVKTTSFFLLYSISKCSKRLHLHIKITTFFSSRERMPSEATSLIIVLCHVIFFFRVCKSDFRFFSVSIRKQCSFSVCDLKKPGHEPGFFNNASLFP